MIHKDTIYALSTPPGRGAIGVVRVSGPRTRHLLERVAPGPLSPRVFQLRVLRDPATAEALDQAVVIWLPGPATFTGEDCAEFQVHASPAVLKSLFAVLSRHDGVRLAEPGEFTRRAVHNGRMDLVEAEGLADLLAAHTAQQSRQALSQVLGKSSSIFDSWRERLISIRADIEAVLDFADEEGVAEAAVGRIDSQISELLAILEAEVQRSRSGEIIRDGLRVVLAGQPNTGKSSLLNAVARREAAIVSAMPGTTRDVIEVFVDVGGFPVILTDTAGLRDVSDDVVEIEGMRRTRERLGTADVVVWVSSPDIPGSEKPDPDLIPDLMVCTKSDLFTSETRLVRNDVSPRRVNTSVRTDDGLADFIAALKELASRAVYGSDSAVVVGQRQRDAVKDSIRFLNEALALSCRDYELKAENIRLAAEAVGRLTGRTEVEEWLGAIFSRFCIGK